MSITARKKELEYWKTSAVNAGKINYSKIAFLNLIQVIRDLDDPEVVYISSCKSDDIHRQFRKEGVVEAFFEAILWLLQDDPEQAEEAEETMEKLLGHSATDAAQPSCRRCIYEKVCWKKGEVTSAFSKLITQVFPHSSSWEKVDETTASICETFEERDHDKK